MSESLKVSSANYFQTLPFNLFLADYLKNNNKLINKFKIQRRPSFIMQVTLCCYSLLCFAIMKKKNVSKTENLQHPEPQGILTIY